MVKGRTGAKRASYKHPNPRSLLAEIMDGDAWTDENAVFKSFRDRVESEHVEAIISWWFTNNYRSFYDERSLAAAAATRSASNAAARASGAKTAKSEPIKLAPLPPQSHVDARMLAVVKRNIAKIVLGAMVLPNGKALNDCTGDEVLEAAGIMGPWLRAVGLRVPDGLTVGQSVPEDELQSLYATA